MKKTVEVKADPPPGKYCLHYKTNIDNPCPAMRTKRNVNSGYGDQYYCTFFEQSLWPTQLCGIRIPKCEECMKATEGDKVTLVYNFLEDLVDRIGRGHSIPDYDEVMEALERWKKKPAYQDALKFIEEDVEEHCKDERKRLEKIESEIRSGFKERKRLRAQIKRWHGALIKLK